MNGFVAGGCYRPLPPPPLFTLPRGPVVPSLQEMISGKSPMPVIPATGVRLGS